MGVADDNGVVVEESKVSGAKGKSLGSSLAEGVNTAPKIRKATIINLINYANFSGDSILAHLIHSKTGEELIVKAFPEPCVNELTAWWLKDDSYNPSDFNPMDYILRNILIEDGKSLIVAPVETISISEDLFVVSLPVKGRIWNKRRSRRYSACNGIDARIMQDNNRLEGSLTKFSSSDICIKLDPGFAIFFERFNLAKPFFVELSRNKIIYSGFCTYVKIDFHRNDRFIILSPDNTTPNKKVRRENRNPRLNLKPAPKIVFSHPFSNKTVELELTNLSSSGFAVQLSNNEYLFIPGLIIHELSIVVNGNTNLRCTACVVYQMNVDEKNIRCGFSILDMEMNHFNQLFAIVCNADNPHINLSPELDLNLLWKFFFKSGFIYPKKYKLIGSDCSRLMDTYKRLYQKGREIFAYITYQENGEIYGHCSIIRAYQRTWLVQHLAAIPLAGNLNLVGIHVLNQVLNYLDIIFKLPSFKIDYLMFYYRPDNRFSEYFFGGLYKKANNPKIISQDTFAYLSCPPNLNVNTHLNGLKIEEISSNEYKTINEFYQKQSGDGLFVKSSMPNMDFDEEPLKKVYKRTQLNRAYKVYSLREYDKLKAVFIIDQSDIGINMSELLNCIKIIIIDINLPWEDLNRAINVLGVMYSKDNVSALVYPTEYLNKNNIAVDRYYNLWIIDAKYGHEYINYLKQEINPRMPLLLNIGNAGMNIKVIEQKENLILS